MSIKIDNKSFRSVHYRLNERTTCHIRTQIQAVHRASQSDAQAA